MCVCACVSLKVLRVSQLSLGARLGVQSSSSGLLALGLAAAAFSPNVPQNSAATRSSPIEDFAAAGE